MASTNGIAQLLLPSDAQQRRQTLHDLVNQISDEDATFLDELLSQRKAKYDILGNLPTELVLHVLDYLDLRDIHTYVRVCRRWRDISRSQDIVNHLHSKWLPFNDRSSDQKLRDLSLSASKAYLGTTGRFPRRITTTFQESWSKHGGASPSRLEGLQQNHTYRDVVCVGDTIRREQMQEPDEVVYAHGVMAWQKSLIIYTHDLRQNVRGNFVIPTRTVMAVGPLRLRALGNRLAVATSSRKICAWNIASGAFSEADVPSRPTTCVTHDNFVLVSLSSGSILVWEPSHRLVEVDISLLLNVTPYSPESIRSAPLIVHPAEPGTFFFGVRSSSRPLPTVCEITPTARGYAVSRVFTYSPSDLSCLSDLSSEYLEARRVDDQGTFQLMKLFRKNTYEPCHYQYLMFNILTREFSTQDYLSPINAYLCPRGLRSRVSCIWGGQLLFLSNDHLEASSDPHLVALDQRQLSSQSLPKGVRKNFRQYLQQLAPGINNEFDKNHTDVIRHDDFTVQYPAAPDYHAVFGFQYVARPFSGACTYGGGHESSCQSGTAASLPYGVTTPAFANFVDRSRQTTQHPRSIPHEIYMDGDFLVIWTVDYYTVYCANGGLAVTMQYELRDRSQ